jgi:hypothetical protein
MDDLPHPGVRQLRQWAVFARGAVVLLGLVACSADRSHHETYEVPEHIREHHTLRQDSYGAPRPDNAPIDPQFKGFFSVPEAGQQRDAPTGAGERPDDRRGGGWP